MFHCSTLGFEGTESQLEQDHSYKLGSDRQLYQLMILGLEASKKTFGQLAGTRNPSLPKAWVRSCRSAATLVSVKDRMYMPVSEHLRLVILQFSTS